MNGTRFDQLRFDQLEPAYTLRVSPRARRMHLVVNALDGLTVVVPRRFDPARVEALVASRHDWIERAQRRFEAERHHLTSSRAAGPPGELVLQGLGEAWQVRYQPSAARRVQAREGAGDPTLTLSGHVRDPELVAAALRRFVARRTLAVLEPELRAMATARELPIGTVSVRAQRTRWASCSASGAISLNRNLAFLPTRLVHHVLVHELCHRLEMNHSPAFWRLLDAEEPNRRALEAELHSAWRFIPAWARR